MPPAPVTLLLSLDPERRRRLGAALWSAGREPLIVDPVSNSGMPIRKTRKTGAVHMTMDLV